MEVEQVLDCLGTSPDTGLSSRQAAACLAQYGPNALPQASAVSFKQHVFEQCRQPLVVPLLVAVLITALLKEWADSAVIAGVVILNTAIGAFQQSKAEKSIAALARLVPPQALVQRDARRQFVDAHLLVPGDMVFIQPGDRVPADLRIFESCGLAIDESLLTGESVAVPKNSQPVNAGNQSPERSCMAYAGTFVVEGSGTGIAVATGLRTQSGRITELVREVAPLETPLMRRLRDFSQRLLIIILVLTGLALLAGMVHGRPLYETFLAAVALAVGGIPEGLPAALTIVFAIGVHRMAGRNAIVRHLPAVETLGCATVICTDKTGTLTENRLSLSVVFAGGRELTRNAEGDWMCDGEVVAPIEDPALRECLVAALLCNEAQALQRNRWSGDPTEAALLQAAHEAGLLRWRPLQAVQRRGMIPFDSNRGYRATLHVLENGETIYKIGAAEKILPRCDFMTSASGTESPVSRDFLFKALDRMSGAGLRVVAIARRRISLNGVPLQTCHVGSGLTFLGFAGLSDSARPEAARAVRDCLRAGISVKMITGDHPSTALGIATQTGLLADGLKEGDLLTGADLSGEGDISARINKATVFARILPAQKLQIIRSLQLSGEIVAMTGDGVNDAPALRQADLGIAMGVSGTEVAKDSADLVLADDRFATIRDAVEEGRGVFENIRKFLVWTLPTNLGEAGVLLVAIMVGWPLPALPVQLLWVNMSTAVLLGLTLVFEPRENDLMTRPPRNPRAGLFPPVLLVRTVLVAVLLIGGGLLIFHVECGWRGTEVPAARTAVVNFIVLVEAVYLWSCRSLGRGFWTFQTSSNPWMLAGLVAMGLAQWAFNCVPSLQAVFHTRSLDGTTWLLLGFLALLVFIIVETHKMRNQSNASDTGFEFKTST